MGNGYCITSNPQELKKIKYSKLLEIISEEKLQTLPDCNIIIDQDDYPKCSKFMSKIPQIKEYTILCQNCNKYYTRVFKTKEKLEKNCYPCIRGVFLSVLENQRKQGE